MAATEKQKKFAAMIAQTLGEEVPIECDEDMDAMKQWIDEHIMLIPLDEDGNRVFKPSDKQTSYAENIAKRLNEVIPSECYINGRKMSNWIDEHVEAFKAASPKKQQVAL